MITYYTDGSASPNPGPGGFSVIKELQPHILGGEPSGEITTNIRMEGLAIKAALQDANGAECQIFTDSEFWINVITKWAPNWQANGWKKKGGDIKNLDIVQSVVPIYQASNAKLTWVRGHEGDEGNELADEWANKAREQGRTDPIAVEPATPLTAVEHATGYLDSVKVMQLATVSDGKPWISTVFFIADTDKNIYWLSEPHRRHSQDLTVSPNAAIAIAAKLDKPVVGIQAEGVVEIVSDVAVAELLLPLYVQKYSGAGKDFVKLLKNGANKHQLYKMNVQNMTMFDELHFADQPSQVIVKK
ncbi:MAG: hypothetical protein EOO17_04465 [Chloroflexi bacterium]|nr:MAG: hypothetical protein EOO17_04465 [Chloroflexota bacterium]